jgi:hypothetical protein
VCAWLCLFLKESRLADPTECELQPEPFSPALKAVFDETYNLAEFLEVGRAAREATARSPFASRGPVADRVRAAFASDCAPHARRWSSTGTCRA